MRRLIIFICLLMPLLGCATGFVPNAGQWDEEARYRMDIPGGVLWVCDGYLLYDLMDKGAIHDKLHDGKALETFTRQVIRVDFPRSNRNLSISADSAESVRYSYFIGNQPSQWAAGLRSYNLLTIHDLWPGVNLQLIGIDGVLKTNFVLQPGISPATVQMHYSGHSGLELLDSTVQVKSALGRWTEMPPTSWADDIKYKTSQPVRSAYTLSGDIVGFEFGSYPRGTRLTIDPTVIFATFSGSVADNFGFTGTFDADGYSYSGGTVYAAGFPTKIGVFQQSFAGGVTNIQEEELARDCGILKYSRDGKQLLWATYLGGRGNEQPHSMVVANGSLYIMGTTSSNDFPAKNAYDVSHNGRYDIFVAKMTLDGSSITNCTYVGGSSNDGINVKPLAFNYADPYRGEVNADLEGDIYVVSCTSSSDFPFQNGTTGLGSNGGGGLDGVVMKLDPSLASISWSIKVGANGHDAVYGMAFQQNVNDPDLLIVGGTNSSNFTTTTGALQPTIAGNIDGFCARITRDGQTLISSTLMGTSAYDQIFFVQTDEVNRVYVAGQTAGTWPVVGDVWKASTGRQFISILNPDLSGIVRSTSYGSGRFTIDLSPSAFVVDLCGRIMMSGWGGAVNNSTNPATGFTHNLPITPDAYQSKTDGSDFHLIIFSRLLGDVVYGSYFGGPSAEEHVDGGTSRFDREGKVYQSVCGGCGGLSDFPTTPDAWSRVNRGKRPYDPSIGGCNNAFFKIDLNSSQFAPEMRDTLLVITVTDTLDYTFKVIDRDKVDSIFVTGRSEIFGAGKVLPPFATLDMTKGKGETEGRLRWVTACHHASDTFLVTLYLSDNGCPTPRVDTAYITIVVLPPPPITPPAIFCLDHIGENTVSLEWSEYPNLAYLQEYRLVRVDPNGTETQLYAFGKNDLQSFADGKAFSNLTQDYCYFIYGINICGEIGDSTRKICSVPDVDSLPPPVYVYTVTVEQNRSIGIQWQRYPREDFYAYDIYRRENVVNRPYQLYAQVRGRDDTIYLDSFVDVHHKSYCYQVVVRTQCGLISVPGNHGCSILLAGTSEPWQNHTYWNPYEYWPAGVDYYDILRRDPSRPQAKIAEAIPLKRQYTDTALDIEQGLYWYQVRAHENIGGFEAISLSNEVLLIQPPVLIVPNVFSPNGDGINDNFITVPAFVKGYNLMIFNRWGQFVWESNDKHTFWDGTYNGNTPFNNVYIWQVTYTGFDDSKYFQNGWITTVR